MTNKNIKLQYTNMFANKVTLIKVLKKKVLMKFIDFKFLIVLPLLVCICQIMPNSYFNT